MAANNNNAISLLSYEQLSQLANIIYRQEVDAIKSLRFSSEFELAKYLRDCKASFESAVGLLEDARSIERWFTDPNKDHVSIAHDIYGFIVNAANHAFQTVRNYTLRLNYLNKIRAHAKSLGDALATLDDNVTNIQRLAKEATQYRNAMLEYTRKYQSPASRQFSRWLKDTGIKFDELVKRYQAKLKFEGPFGDLDEIKKIQVYEAIIEASGRGNVIVNTLSKVFGAAGIAVLLFAAGVMVWDIFSADHKIERAVHDAVVTAASIGGAVLGEVVGVAVATHISVAAEASALFVLMAGVTFSIVGAFLIGAFAGWLVDLIIGSGGTAPLSTQGHRCYVTPLPDGIVLARQITHHS